MIKDEDASPALLDALSLARTPHGTVDNVMRVHSLRPSTMRGHVALYRAALHDDSNTIPMWFQETIASYVSLLNDCDYSFANHWANAKHLINDTTRSTAVEKALRANEPDQAFQGSELELLKYARKLTLEPAAMIEQDISALRQSGVDDGQILEANQIIGYFNYANRLLNGLGVTTEGDIVGYYSEDKE